MHILSLILGALITNCAQLVWATDAESLRVKYKEDFEAVRVAFEKRGKPKFHKLATDMRKTYDNLPASEKQRIEKRGLFKGVIEKYVNRKLAGPLYRQVEKRTAVHVSKAVAAHKRELTLMKRDGVQLSKRELEDRASKMTKDIAAKVKKDMLKASKVASEKFQADHIKSYRRR